MEKSTTVTFTDANDHRWILEIEITERNGYPEFTMSGKTGQCYDSIEPNGKHQKELIDIWHKWHLNNEDNPLPKGFWNNILTLISKIEKEEKERFNSKPVIECTKEELRGYSRNIIALGYHLNLTINELKDIKKKDYGYGNNYYMVHGEEYYSGTNKQMFKAVKEYFEETLWAFDPSFLGKYGSLKEIDDVASALKPIQELCESGNNVMKALVDWNKNADRITKDTIKGYGIGTFLNSYDGKEKKYDVFGATYIVC